MYMYKTSVYMNVLGIKGKKMISRKKKVIVKAANLCCSSPAKCITDKNVHLNGFIYFEEARG